MADHRGRTPEVHGDLVSYLHPKDTRDDRHRYRTRVLDIESILAAADFRRVEPFDFQWPKNKGEVQPPEHYEEAYEARVKLAGREQSIRIGLCDRESAGDKHRRRAVVFLGLAPMVEFSGETPTPSPKPARMASVIKLPSGQHLRPGDSIPPRI